MESKTKLKEVTTKIGSGSTPRGGKASYSNTGKYRLIRSQNIYNHHFEWSGLAYISEEQAEKLKNVIVEKDDILINITGDSVARNLVSRENYLPARVNQHVAIIRCDQKKLNPFYLSAILTSKQMQEHLLSLAQSGATRAALTKSMLENIEIPLVSLDNQKRIGDILHAINEKININVDIIKNLESMSRSFFKHWFIDFEFPDAEGRPYKSSGGKMVESELGDIPEGWPIRKLNELGDLKNGINYSRDTVGDTIVEVANVRDIVGKQYFIQNSLAEISIDKSKADKYLLQKGDTLIVRSASPGETVFLNNDRENAVYSGFVIRFRPFDQSLNKYLFMNLRGLKNELDSYSTGTTLKNLNQKILSSISVFVPTLDIVEAFNNLLTPLFDLMESKQDENNRLMSLRDALLPKLVSGEIKLPQDEVTVHEPV